MRKTSYLLALVIAIALLAQGCGLRVPQVPNVKKVSVTTVVKTKPLAIGGKQSTSVSFDNEDVKSEPNTRLDPTTGKPVPGGAGDTVLSYEQPAVAVPSDLSDALDVDVEAVYFQAALPEGVDSGTVAVEITAPGGETVTLVANVQDGQNKLDLSPETKEQLAQILQSTDLINLKILADGGLGNFSISNLQIQAAAVYNKSI